MLTAPVTAVGRSSSGPRPINLAKDTRQVLKLLDLSFGRNFGSLGHRVLYDRLSLSQVNPLALRFSMMTSGFIPGFVWEEEGRIVGNLSLIGSEVPGRYLIANVAVHPNFRRRGIARGLLQEAIDHVIGWGGRTVMLQVESDNDPAISLYLTSGFQIIGTMKRWQSSPSNLRYVPIQADSVGQLREIGRRDWRAAYHLDRAMVHPDLNWPVPAAPDFYQTGVWRSIVDFLNGRKFKAWIADLRNDPSGRRKLIGLSSISSEWGRPTWLRLSNT
jgi:ribosomal protein S18 acetylase RimI-like enzyme